MFSGDTLAYTDTLSNTFSSSSSVISSTSLPVSATSPSLYIPIDFAMAVAVTLWSPVIIIGLIPASFAFSTASIDSSLGGSIIETKPIKV